MGALVLGLAIHENMAKKFHEIFAGKFLTKFHNTLQECFCRDIFSGGPRNPLPAS